MAASLHRTGERRQLNPPAEARRLRVSVVTTSVEHGIGWIEVDSPPVNALGHAVRCGLLNALHALECDNRAAAIVILCVGKTFFVGADISEFDHPPREPLLPEVLAAIDASTKPVIAAIHGYALGGGLELALACHYRVAAPSARLGLPEVKLGILPGAGGTQRLPRLIGPARALNIIAFGEPISSICAKDMGMIDALAGDGAIRDDARDFANAKLDEAKCLPRVSDRNDKIAPGAFDPALFDEFRERHPELMRGYKAPAAIVRAIEAAVELPFGEGLLREQELFQELRASKESAAQRYFFFAQRRASKPAGAIPLRDGAIAQQLGDELFHQAEALALSSTADRVVEATLAEFGFPETLLDRLRRGQRSDRYVRLSEGKSGQKSADRDLIVRLLYPLVNRAAKLIEDGNARVCDIDVAAITELGWPVFTGGPLYWADTLGLASIVDSLRGLAADGTASHPAKLLVELALSGSAFTR